MLHRTRSWAHVALILVVVLLSLPVVSAQDAKPEAVGLRPDAPQYALHGPYWVGTQTFMIDEKTNNPLRITIWYPALNPQGLEEAVVYTMAEDHVLRDMIPADAPFTVLGRALENAVPDRSGAPYPLVINSHGFTSRMWQTYLGEHLASYGFVVIAPEHAHDDWAAHYTSMVHRFMEIKQSIAYAENMTTPDGKLPGMIDVEHIAVGGHSSGGMTTYGAAGAPLNWVTVKEYCIQVPTDPICVNLDQQFKDIQALLDVDTPEDQLMPPIWDSRIDAIFPMAGSIEFHGEEVLKVITVPMLTLYGMLDPAFKWLSPAYEQVSSTKKAQVVFENGAHGLFYNGCEAFPYLKDYDLFWACSDAVWDIDRAADLTNHFTTAFLLDVLKGDKEAHAALAPNAVSFTGIEYQAEGY